MSDRNTEANAGQTVDAEEQEVEEILAKVDDTIFVEDDWNVVVIETKTLSYSWEDLVVYLGLPPDVINNTIRPASNPWNEALNQWIKHNYNTKRFGLPSWRTLLKAVAQVNKLQCKKLADKHRVGAHIPAAIAKEPTASATREEMAPNAPLSSAEREASRKIQIWTPSVGSASKPKLTFPCLSLKTLCEEDKELLRQRLYAESEDMMYKFQTLFTSTTNSLCTRQVTVKDLARRLRGLGHLKPTFKDVGEGPLRHHLAELERKESVDDAMSVIMNYCSFFNYRMLEHIINELGAEEDRENLARYKEDFARYGERHVFECPAVVGEMSEEGQANMFVTLDDSFDNCNVNHLYAFVSNLEKVLNIDNMSLRLCRIAPGSLKLIFQLPLSVQQAIFPLSCDQESALAGLGVTHLSCGDYQFTSLREEKMETEDPASDEDLGHSDSGGSVGSMDVVSRDCLKRCLDEAVARFRSKFGGESPDMAVYAPGRVNLIGEHTDYNNGFVMPMALPLVTVIVGRKSKSSECHLVSCSIDEACPAFSVPSYPSSDDPYVVPCGRPTWAKYIKGVVALMNKNNDVPAFEAVVSSCVPLGGGVSSSAALEVATLFFVEQLVGGTSLSPQEKALLCQEAEHRYAGNNCGIMDQFISVMAKEGHALLIDCRNYSTVDLPLRDPNLVILVVDTGVRHKLVDGEYNARRESCASAAKKLGKTSLREATMADLEAAEKNLTDIEYRRARHVITEIDRTTKASELLQQGDYKGYGLLMNASHESLRVDYEVTCKELDELVEIIREDKQVYGSRMTGGGFGGCTVTLLPSSAVDQTIERIKSKYTGSPKLYIATASSGAGVVPEAVFKASLDGH